MAAMVARQRQQPAPNAIAAARGGNNNLRRSARTRWSQEHGQLGEDGTMAMNLAVERRSGAPSEKMEREERRRLELTYSSRR
jgi:hypothetical protein